MEGWQPGDPDITTFDVRFFDDLDCEPDDVLAEYLSATPDTIHLGNCADGRPCFRYELDVEVAVGPSPFWMSVMAVVTDTARRYPPKWGRLGDEVVFGCPTVFWNEDEGGWDDPPVPPDWDASHLFVLGVPTRTEPSSWGRLKSMYR